MLAIWGWAFGRQGVGLPQRGGCSIEDGIHSVSVKPSVLGVGRRPGDMLLEMSPGLCAPLGPGISEHL